jgi:predicted glutamine amidotransferase
VNCSPSTPTPPPTWFSFRGLSRRGGASGEHADGWGLASFTPDGHGLTLLREEAPAAFSALADQLADRSPKALVSIAHIRKATRGQVALENCHPFSRSWSGQTWVFAHNGDLLGAIPLGDHYRPFGSTDSEAAFCWILEELDQARVDPVDTAALFEQLHRCAADLAERGTFNALISNGQWLFATATSKLHWLTRRAPFCTATLADPPIQVDFSALTTSNDVVTILSTEPLTTDEHWQPFQAGESLLLLAGEVIQRSRHAIRPVPNFGNGQPLARHDAHLC